MSLVSAQRAISDRSLEVGNVLRCIQDIKPDVGSEDAQSGIRALALVHIYSLIEFSLNRIVQDSINIVNSARIRHADCGIHVYPLTLDAAFNRIVQPGKTGKWKARKQLLETATCSDLVSIPPTAMSLDLQNIWASTFDDVFQSFGIDSPSTIDPRTGIYIDEIVEKRNALAHGRTSAIDIGRSYTISDLVIRHQVVDRQMNYCLSVFSNWLGAGKYRKPP